MMKLTEAKLKQLIKEELKEIGPGPGDQMRQGMTDDDPESAARNKKIQTALNSKVAKRLANEIMTKFINRFSETGDPKAKAYFTGGLHLRDLKLFARAFPDLGGNNHQKLFNAMDRLVPVENRKYWKELVDPDYQRLARYF